MTDAEPAITAHEGIKELLREQIATQYLESPDFNGVAAAQLMDVAGKFSIDPEVVLAELVADDAVYANFGHEIVNRPGLRGVALVDLQAYAPFRGSWHVEALHHQLDRLAVHQVLV